MSARAQRLAAVACAFIIGSNLAWAECYDRKLYGRWVDVDSDCQNTRHELLIQQSLRPPAFNDRHKCRVVTGRWLDPYILREHYSARAVEIDHLVALAEAHESGAHAWSKAQRRKFANDIQNLRVTARKINRDKGKKDVAEWLPDRRRREYAQAWVGIKRKYGLSIDAREARALRGLGVAIAGLAVAPEYRCPGA